MRVELYSVIRYLRWMKDTIADKEITEANNAKMSVLEEVIEYLEELKE